MRDRVRNAVITSYLSQTRDRFHIYNEPKTTEERLQSAATLEGFDGVEMVFPYEVLGPEETRRLLDENGVDIAAVNVNVKAEPEFRDGGLTSNDGSSRAKAVRFIKEAKDFASEVGADKVTCCPLSDGYEFSFHCDYSRKWGYLTESLRAAGEYKPEIPLFIEYKPSETRGRCFVDSAAKCLLLLREIGLDKMGVTLDFGHSVYGSENPAEAVALIGRSPFPFYVHINDNDGRWDWDYMVGTKHFLDYVEFLFYLQEFGYEDYLTSDTSPTRWNIKETFEANARLTNKIWRRLRDLDRILFKRLIAEGEYLETWKFIETEIFHLD